MSAAKHPVIIKPIPSGGGIFRKKDEVKSKYFIDNLKDFQKIGKLGSGSYGTVYKIRNTKTEEILAAKVIRYHDGYDITVKREIDILIQIQHPTIIELRGYSNKDFGENIQKTIVMNYMSKGSLLNLIDDEDKGFCPDDYNNTKRQIILIGIARGMMILHEQNVIHRDLKPENILLENDYSPRISDFGLSKFYDPKNSMDQSTNNVGTLAYAAPEILRGDSYNNKADVYSFGILMYEVLNSVRAYKDMSKNTTYISLSNNIASGYRPKFNGYIKEGFKNLIEICWSQDFNERPTFSEIFQKLSLLHDEKFVPYEKGKISDGDYMEAMQYCLDDVDCEEVFTYIQKVYPDLEKVEKSVSVKPPTSPRPTTASPRKAFIQTNMKNREDYNLLYNIVHKESIEEQKDFLSKSSRANQFFTKLRKFLDFVDIDDGYCFFNYDEKSDTCELIEEPEMYIKFMLTEKLLSDNCFINNEFIEILKSFNKVYIEIDFKSYYFESIIGIVLKLKSIHKCKIAASVIFESIIKIDQILKPFYLIEIVRLNRQNPRISFNETFEECRSMKYLVLNGICTDICIGDNSFRNCISLQEFCSDKKIESIGNSAFESCISLKKVCCSCSVSFLGKNCFEGCYNIRTIYFHYIKIIDSSAFEGCTSLRNLNIKSIGKVCSNAFKGCYSLEEITIDYIEIIESNAFEKCTSLRTININYIKMIDSYSFKECSSLKVINSNKIEKIMSNAFEGCKSLSKINVDNIGIVDSNVFKHFYNLTEINSKEIKKIMSHAFEDCTSLMTINVENIEFIDSFAFKNCSSLIRINNKEIKTVMSNAFEGCSTIKGFKTNISEIYSNCFKNCSSLEYFMVKNYTLKSIEEGVFEGCSSLKKIEINVDNMYNPPIKYIKKSAFKGCSSINHIKANFEVEIIEESAFENCLKLESFDFSKAKEIKSRCFYNCCSLKQIIIPEGITKIPKNAFFECSSFETLSIPTSVTIIEEGAFARCFSLIQVLFPSTVEKICSNAFNYCISLPFISIPKSVKMIGTDALKNCFMMKEITISPSLKIEKAGLGDYVKVNKF
ncbi:hypothetical protein M9Y10_038822 [Tritrichomonas musculus]|uniref:Protein kinase domain-containing protein n=1 Tax=Tritrichomonas musculus TaxID=1915356 RepID=A0ABR2KAH2_9EUKA